jgi:hypothetical protein
MITVTEDVAYYAIVLVVVLAFWAMAFHGIIVAQRKLGRPITAGEALFGGATSSK